MSNPVTIVCNFGCGKKFTCKITDKNLGDGVVKHVLKCPFCGKEYRIHYSNIESRRLRQKLKDERQTMPTEQLNCYIDKINSIEADLKRSVEG